MEAAYARAISVILLAVCVTAPPCLAADAIAELMTWECSNRTYYAPNTTYQSNVAAVIASLAANASRSSPVGFATATLGAGPDTVWGVALCRGDTNGTACASCLALSPGVGFGQCRGARDVSAFYDRCLLRYSDVDFLARPDNNEVQVIGFSKASVVTSGGAERFGALVAYLIGALSDLAAFNTTSRYAVGVVNSDEGFRTTTTEVVHIVSGMVQCTPEQTPAVCRGCLQGLMNELPANGSIGAQINAVWCRLRYEVWEFFDGGPMLKLVAPPWIPSSSANRGNGTRGIGKGVMATAIVLGVFVILLSAFTVCLWTNSNTKLAHLPNEDDYAGSSLLFDLPTLRRATSDFADENKLGHGGFGAVYKGWLPDGREIAVKRLDKASRQGMKELKNELLVVVKLRHNNLAKLLGVCINGHEKLLVYEYLPNRSLDMLLFDRRERAEPLDWPTRYNVIYGVARGLLYLHEDSQAKIIHRDLKASNILLDGDMTPKISDFGLARLFDGDKTNTITSRIVGTLGYMAPEYAVLGQLSVKLDVFSFGVLILEIVTGRRSTDAFESLDDDELEPISLVSYVWDHWSKGAPLEVMDGWLQRRAPPESEVLKCIHLGLLCVQENPADRPTMLTVLVMLHGDASSFDPPSRPAFAYAASSAAGADSSTITASSGRTGEEQGGVVVVVAAAAATDDQGQGSVNSMSMSEFQPR